MADLSFLEAFFLESSIEKAHLLLLMYEEAVFAIISSFYTVLTCFFKGLKILEAELLYCMLTACHLPAVFTKHMHTGTQQCLVLDHCEHQVVSCECYDNHSDLDM